MPFQRVPLDHVNVGDEAAGLIRGPRAKFYGPPWINLNNIGTAWSLYLSAKTGTEVTVTGHDVCQLMILLKALRGAQSYHRDSTADTRPRIRSGVAIMQHGMARPW